jgi:tetratricopeptide (TPR) repeat protein
MLKKTCFAALVLAFCFSLPAFAQQYDFGDKSSKTLTGKAWDALKAKDANAVVAYVDECVKNFKTKALEQQASLTDFPPKETTFDYWALNDVGTCLFIKGMALKEQGNTEAAKKAFSEAAAMKFAQCWDPEQEAFWKVAEGAEDQIIAMEQGLDFGNYTSETLTVKAWEALGAQNHDAVIAYTRKCIKLYSKEADRMQAELKDYAAKENAFNYWALNDVGTCYFIMGEAYMAKKENAKALEAYKTVVDKYSFSQCWDPKGWFWKPAVAARGKVNKIQAESGMMH